MTGPALSPLDSAPHILVVDDEPEIAESLADFLVRKEGFRVSVVGNGREALIFLQHSLRRPADVVDLILLDMRMPVMSGLQVLERLRRHPQLCFTRVIVLTAAAGNQEKVEALSAGADDYLTKPYYPHELLARVKNMLRSRQLEKQLQRQSEQLAALNLVSQAATATLDPQQVLSAAAAGVDAVVPVQLAAIFMRERSAEVLRCRHLHGANDHSAPADFPVIPIENSVLGTAFRQKKSLYLNEPAGDARFRPELDAPPGLAVQNMAAAPLVVRGRPVGVLAAYNKLDGRFLDVDADLLASLATSIGRAVENAWLFQRVQQRQQELLESRNTLHAVIDGILDPIYMIDEAWQLVAVNRNKADEMETTPESLIGQVCYRVFFGRVEPCDHCQAALALVEQQAHRWAVADAGPGHQLHEWDVSAYPVPDAPPGTARTVLVWQDRTEERRLENSLMQAGKLAAIGQLAAGVAHEISNPLTAINANAQMLKMVFPPEDDNIEAVDLIVRAGDRAAKVVRGLLDFARQAQYDFEPTDVNETLQQALGLVSYQLSSANIGVFPNLAEGLPEVVASGEHLKSVWLNLLVNARDAVQDVEGERRIEIESGLSSDGSAVEVTFRDNGRGMTPAEMAHIFEPFYTTKDPGKGTGLGLATSHRIVAQHSGTIEVSSVPAAGATFTVRLPVSGE
jgi:two-component system NtrC family sensor kinase